MKKASKDEKVIRDLAKQVAEIAQSPEMERSRRRWRDVNALRRPDRAPVWCKPVGAWEELLPATSLRCADRRLRGIERAFRQVLIKRDIGDDSVMDPFFDVAPVIQTDPPTIWGVEPRKHRPAEAGGAWQYDPPLKSPADLDRLRLPRLTLDHAATQRALDAANDLLGDILPVRLSFSAEGHRALSATLGTAAADLRGLEPMMMDAASDPDFLHRLMAHLRDANLSVMRQVEELGLLTPETVRPMYCCDPIGPGAAKDGFARHWCAANSQEFDQFSPPMWEEFCLAYQKPIFEKYGLVGYGCCENLTRKIDGVLTIPNLRIFVCSAWTNLDIVLEKVSPRYCIMWRQKASDVVFAEGDEAVRRPLEEGARKLKGRPYQIVLRELQTLAGHPDRLHVWTRLAREAAERYA